MKIGCMNILGCGNYLGALYATAYAEENKQEAALRERPECHPRG
jgi:hypothetical protein